MRGIFLLRARRELAHSWECPYYQPMNTNRPAAYYAMQSVKASRMAVWHEDRGTQHASMYNGLCAEYLADAMRILA